MRRVAGVKCQGVNGKGKSAVTSISMSQRQFHLSLELNRLISLVDVKKASFLRTKKFFSKFWTMF